MTLRVGWAVPEQRPRPNQGLTITPSGATKIARRGYVLDDAQAVYERSPKWIWQDERFAQDETGEVSVRPAAVAADRTWSCRRHPGCGDRSPQA